jgi:tRNA threonylcarbamoyladenosine biosynthesis protein TsaB
MFLLAADTSGKHGSIALAHCGPGKACTVIEMAPLEGGTFSAQLVPQIAALLTKHGAGKQDIGAFAVVSGPGSFTGLRIGLAAIKALAEVLAKPIAAVSLLEAIAVSGRSQGKLVAVLDAGRGEVYAGEYEVHVSGAHLVRERLLTRSELVASAVGSIVITPDQGLGDVVSNAGLQVERIELPRSDVVAWLGWQKILAEKTVLPEQLQANYVRSDAQIFSRRGS